jgi:hypothetical protein
MDLIDVDAGDDLIDDDAGDATVGQDEPRAIGVRDL